MKRHASLLYLSTLVCSSTVVATDLTEVVVTASRLGDPASMLVSNSASLTAGTLDLVGATHVQEALVRVPGIDLHRNNGQEYLPAIRSPVLSGPGACGSFLMAEDGIPLRPAGFCNVNELFEAHTEQAQRIEVLRGPGNALYGANALHGVVNVIEPASFGRGWRAGLEGGPHDYLRTKLSFGDERLAAALTLDHDGGYRHDSGVDQQKLSMRHRFTGQRAEITSGLTITNLNQETAGFIEGLDAYKDRELAH